VSKGIIYITTTSVTGLIKIGKTRSDAFQNRMTVLEQNGYWNVNGLKRYYAVEVDDYDEKEKLIHTIFSKSQVATSELFALDKELAKEVLRSFDGRQIYPVVDSTGEVYPKYHVHKATRLTFAMLGISVGTQLTYTDNPNIKVTTVDNASTVEYNGKLYTLSGLVSKLKGGGAYQGGGFFTYQGETLVHIRKRLGL
jgi:hypothetical protein